mmetsp:Transcript_20874/g.38731  ORF Transcript_20874/g.38731 Transcript_20874/m.38731 type:complete len:309 (-) Transcript_20874:41-967(-)
MKQIETLRVSKQVEINDSVNVAKKVMLAKFQEQLALEKANFEVTILGLKKKIEELASSLHEKSMLIRQLNAVIADQEILLSEVNIEFLRRPKEKARDYTFEDTPQKKSPRNFKTELKTMKEICKIYEMENISAKLAAKEAKEREEQERAQREFDKLKYEEALKLIEDTIRKELEDEKIKNALFQADASSELLLRENLNGKQHEMIKALQEELKSAKAILQSKRLHNKYLEALKTTQMEEVPEEGLKTPSRRRRDMRSGSTPKALSTLPRLDRSTNDWSNTSRTPTLRHLKISRDALTKASTSEFSSFS